MNVVGHTLMPSVSVKGSPAAPSRMAHHSKPVIMTPNPNVMINLSLCRLSRKKSKNSLFSSRAQNITAPSITTAHQTLPASGMRSLPVARLISARGA